MAAFSEINLPVGAKLQMTLKYGSKQSVFYTELIGYVEGDYMIVKIPFKDDFLSVQFLEGQPLSFRVFSGVNIFTFNGTVKSIFTAPYYYMHISFPDDVQSVVLRSAIRAKVDLPVQINGPFKPATITDISVSGAAITTDDMLGGLGGELLISFICPVSLTHEQVTIETTVQICSVHQQLPGKQDTMPSKRVYELNRFGISGGVSGRQDNMSPKRVYGVMFRNVSPTNKVILQNFVYESLNR